MKNRSFTFRPWPKNQEKIQLASRCGINVSELVNEILAENVDRALKEKSEKIKKELEMVRGTGFEPVTPTVSR